MKVPNKKTITITAIIASVVIFLIALLLLFFQAATVTIKYGTPAEHGSSYK
jgi:hypothetical protein